LLPQSSATFMHVVCRDICHKAWHFGFSIRKSVLKVSPPVVFVSNLPPGLSNVLCRSKIAGRGTQSWQNQGAIQCCRPCHFFKNLLFHTAGYDYLTAPLLFPFVYFTSLFLSSGLILAFSLINHFKLSAILYIEGTDDFGSLSLVHTKMKNSFIYSTSHRFKLIRHLLIFGTQMKIAHPCKDYVINN